MRRHMGTREMIHHEQAAAYYFGWPHLFIHNLSLFFFQIVNWFLKNGQINVHFSFLYFQFEKK